MDKERAKEFIFVDMEKDGQPMYITKDLDKLIKLNDGSLIGVYAVVDTEAGEKLFEMDFAYSGEPIIMRVFLHKKYYMDYWQSEHFGKDPIDLDLSVGHEK